MKDRDEGVFNYYEVADQTGVHKEIVRDLLRPLGGGSNGITVQNPKFEEKPKE
jgi:hypothetical protein